MSLMVRLLVLFTLGALAVGCSDRKDFVPTARLVTSQEKLQPTGGPSAETPLN
jgi:hypothetical protein